jgi:hypothetical protein
MYQPHKTNTPSEVTRFYEFVYCLIWLVFVKHSIMKKKKKSENQDCQIKYFDLVSNFEKPENDFDFTVSLFLTWLIFKMKRKKKDVTLFGAKKKKPCHVFVGRDGSICS